jgi:hypothetical protein
MIGKKYKTPSKLKRKLKRIEKKFDDLEEVWIITKLLIKTKTKTTKDTIKEKITYK